MGYNIRVPLLFGFLKIKSYSRLRPEERDKQVPVRKFGRTYLIWHPYRTPQTPQDEHYAGNQAQGSRSPPDPPLR